MGVVNTEDYMDMWLLLWEKRTTKYIYIVFHYKFIHRTVQYVFLFM